MKLFGLKIFFEQVFRDLSFLEQIPEEIPGRFRLGQTHEHGQELATELGLPEIGHQKDVCWNLALVSLEIQQSLLNLCQYLGKKTRIKTCCILFPAILTVPRKNRL